MSTLVHAVDFPGVPPLPMPDRFRHEIAYFMSLPEDEGVPPLAAGEYWISLPLARQWLDDGVFSIVSPLDSENRTEIELREEHEDWLTWMVTHEVERVKLG